MSRPARIPPQARVKFTAGGELKRRVAPLAAATAPAIENAAE